MFSLLLRKALPFALTFVLGAGLGWLFKAPDSARRPATLGTFELSGAGPRELPYGGGGRGKRECRMQRLVAESKPLVILFKPDARLPQGVEAGAEGMRRAVVRVTFGADGQVQEVSPLAGWFHARDGSLVQVKATWDAVERAARQIRFTPETVDGVPVSVRREVEIRFLAD